MVEAVPVPGQLLPIQEHHEVRQQRLAVDAARADLAHQVHAHGVAAEGEEGAVAEAQDAGIAPDQIEAQRQERVADVFAEQRHEIVGQTQRRARRHAELRTGTHDDQQHAPIAEKPGPAPRRSRKSRPASRPQLSAARPLSANRPRGRRWMNRMIDHQHDDLAEHRAGDRLQELVDDAEASARRPACPSRLPTPPNTTTMKAVDDVDRAEIGADIADLATAPRRPCRRSRSRARRSARRSRAVRMPIAAAMSRFCVTARMCSPKLVRLQQQREARPARRSRRR